MQHDEWSEVVATTTAEYMKGAQDCTIRDRVVFALLQKRKRISFGQSGTELRWQVKFALPEVEAYTGGAMDFAESDKHRQLAIDWRGYKVTDMMTEKEKLMNRGNQALIERYGRIFPDMEQALMDKFGEELYVDGSTYTDRFSGLETIFAGTDCDAGDLVCRPSGTYGGYSQVPGGVAGSWSANLTTHLNHAMHTDWPSGSGDSEYDFLSPRLVNTSSTAWGTGSTAWVDNCERALRKAIMWTNTGAGKSGRVDMCIMTPEWYYDMVNKLSSLRSIIVPAKEMVEVGFEGFRFDGVEITHEYGVPTETAYLLNLDKMELHLMYDNLFVSKGPEFDIRTDSYLFMLGTYGNWRWVSPKFFSKLHPYA
jgi:hypothetical protein